MFRISAEPIPTGHIAFQSHVGAVVTFDGLVRDINDGLEVLALEYEAFVPLAEKEGARILEECVRKFSVVDVQCVHRTGRLAIGEVAIRVVATGMHRKEAFEACEYVVDEVKSRVPIWKKEHYASGASGWVNCHRVEDDPERPVDHTGGSIRRND